MFETIHRKDDIRLIQEIFSMYSARHLEARALQTVETLNLLFILRRGKSKAIPCVPKTCNL